MKTRSEIELKIRQLKPLLLSRFHVSRIGLFGSFAIGSQTDKSDVDLLVEFSQPIGWDFFTLEKLLEETLSMRVDLITRDALKTRMKETVLNQIQYL